MAAIVLREEQYARLPLDETGLYRSEVFPGLWLDPTAVVQGDTATVLAAIERGLISSAHAAFVARLNTPPGP
jgi:hypothetical protein